MSRSTVLILLVFIALFSFEYVGGSDVVQKHTKSVEFSLAEVSPRGDAGGRMVPASGCSHIHGDLSDPCVGPSITASPNIIRSGGSVDITWNPGAHNNCSLSDNLKGAGNPNTATTVNIVQTGASVYSINCTDGTPQEASVEVYVLPALYET